jgi:outer membrane protein assembly factor BamB
MAIAIRMTWPAIVAIATFSIATAADPVPTTDWPQWRGPRADGVASDADPPVHWDATTNIKWKAPLPGRGSATPIVRGDQVFIATAVPTDRVAADLPALDPRFQVRTDAPKTYYRFEVLSFDRATGALRWRRLAAEKVPHEGHHATHSYAAGSPATDGKHLYVSFGSFGIYCYDLDGNLRWQRDLGRLHTRLGWGEAVTPVVRGDSLLPNGNSAAARRTSPHPCWSTAGSISPRRTRTC